MKNRFQGNIWYFVNSSSFTWLYELRYFLKIVQIGSFPLDAFSKIIVKILEHNVYIKIDKIKH